MSSSPTISETDQMLFMPAVLASMVVVALCVAQSDRFSRLFLTPERLQTKRSVEYRYRWEQANDKALIRAHIYLAGGLDAHQQKLSTQRTAANPSGIWDESGVQALIREWIQQDKRQEKEERQNGTAESHGGTPFPRILGFAREMESREVSVELYHPLSGSYQLPLQRFGLALADILESTLTTTALCFVADASSGLGSQFIAELMEASKAGVAVIREPIWMTAFAFLVAERVISQEKMQRILFGFCRMDALRVRNQVGDARTVLFTLPGQAVTPILLPLLQGAFPEDRHVFAYQSCVESVERGIALRKKYKRATVPGSLEEAVSFFGPMQSSDPTRSTTPLRSALTKSVHGLAEALVALRLYHADTVEAWMASVDAFFKLKDKEATNGYLPYTLKMALLIGDPNGSLEPESDRYYSLKSLMEFITGCRSRTLPEGVLDAAREWLRDFSHENSVAMQTHAKMTQPERKALENCVFKHKSILIQDKTLKDTVLPSKHWTLKQAAKRGCACCAPEEDDEEGDENTRKTDATTLGSSRDAARTNGSYVNGTTSSAFDPTKFSMPTPTQAPSNPKYVDGKTTFAFDPTKFS